jgi:UDP-glucose 4-epimerase
MKEKILVTGGAGFIGAHTALELQQAGYEVTIVDNFSRSDRTLLDGLTRILGKPLNFYEGDCSDKKFLDGFFKKHGPFKCVIHFAAFKSVGESVSDPLAYYRNNVGAMVILLETMKEHSINDLIFSSSCTVYGQPDHVPVSENAEFNKAESPYGATKQMCERIIEDTARNGIRAVSLRYFNPIGAHPSGEIGELPIGPPNNLVPYITQTAAGVRDKLTIFGNDYRTPDGTCIRDFIHVVDLAIAHLKAMEFMFEKKGALMEAFNLGTGVGISVQQLVDTFIKVTGINLAYTVGKRRSGDVEQVYADPEKANRMLKWKTKYSLEESLLHAWNWENKVRHLNS